MAIRYDYYTDPDDSSFNVPEDFYGVGTALAQSFQASNTYSVTRVQLRLRRAGSPGTFTVTIYAADGSGFPTGGALCSGTRDGNSLTTGASGVWYNIDIDIPVTLSSGLSYVIVLTAPEGDYSNYVGWRIDSGGPGGYANGLFSLYIDGTWQDVAPGDFAKDGMFAVWGVQTRLIQLSSPTNTATGIILQPLLQWSISGGAVEGDLLDIYLRKDDANFTGDDQLGFLVDATLNSSWQIVGGLEYDSTYYWQIQAAASEEDDLISSVIWSFTTTPFNPPLPTGISLDESGVPTGTPLGMNNMLTRKRFIAAANNKIWYEDI